MERLLNQIGKSEFHHEMEFMHQTAQFEVKSNSHWKYSELVFVRRECMCSYESARTLGKRAMLSRKENERRDAVARYRTECECSSSHSLKRMTVEILFHRRECITQLGKEGNVKMGRGENTRAVVAGIFTVTRQLSISVRTTLCYFKQNKIINFL